MAVSHDRVDAMTISRELLQSWLRLQRQSISGLQVAYVGLEGASLPAGRLTLCWPDSPSGVRELMLAAELAQRSGAPVSGSFTGEDDGGPMLRIAYPLRLGKDADGAVVVEVKAPLERQAMILQLLRWGEAWLKLAVRQRDDGIRLAAARVVAVAMQPSAYPGALAAITTEMAAQAGAVRVAAGWVEKGRVTLEGVSDVLEVDRRGARAKAVVAVMQAAWDDRETVIATPGDGAASSTIRQLLGMASLSAVCAVPIARDRLPAQVFLFEFGPDGPPGVRIAGPCEDLAEAGALAIAHRRLIDAPWRRRLRQLVADGWGALATRSHARRRLLQLSAAVLLLVLLFTPTDYRVSAPAVIEGAVQRALVVPFDGYIGEALARAGQQVRAGDLLLRLDDRELRSEQRRLRGEAAELDKQHRRALAMLDLSETRVVEARIAQLDARLAVVDEQLGRTELRAPFDGLVLSGDWSRSLGVPVSRGDVVFEVAPLGDYRAALRIADRDIADVRPGQTGVLVLSAMPGDPLTLEITGVTSVLDDPAELPRFRVEARPDGDPGRLRPGMQGVAKVSVGQRQRWWIWTHALSDWLRLQWWRWMP